MEERRKEERLKGEDEVAISVVSGGGNLPKDRIFYALSRDISVSGARIQASSFLPVNTILNIKVTSKHPPRMITALGKVKWSEASLRMSFLKRAWSLSIRPVEESGNLQDFVSSRPRRNVSG
jgi:putative AlgH/UPF0301 family transcriptional regulator